jgi:hypothetical protein
VRDASGTLTGPVARQADGSVATLEVGADGHATSTLELFPGTYWAQEVASSVEGTGLVWNNAVYEVRVDGSDTAEEPVIVTAADVVRRLASAVIEKSGAGYGVAGDASLAGAVFEVRYIDELLGDVTDAQALAVAPTRTWTFVTDENGRIDLLDDDMASGPTTVFDPSQGAMTTVSLSSDDDFEDDGGNRVLLLGTYVIIETHPSTGFLLPDDHVWVETVAEGEEGAGIEVDVEEPHVRGGLEMRKVDATTGDRLSGDASLDATFAVVNRSAASIMYGPEGSRVEVPVGSEIPVRVKAQVRADGSWWATVPDGWLDFGTYEVSEVAAATGHLLDDPYHELVHVTRAGLVRCSHTWSNALMRGGLALAKVDSEAWSMGFGDGSRTDEDDADVMVEGQGNAALVGTRFAVRNESAAAVYVGPVHGATQADVLDEANWVAPGADVCELEVVRVTDDEVVAVLREAYGIPGSRSVVGAFTGATTGTAGWERLPYGRYSIREVAAGEGYLDMDTGSVGPFDVGDRRWRVVSMPH